MDLKFYLSAFLRRWWIIALTTVLVGGVTHLRISKETVNYVAEARLLYESNNIASSVMGSTGMFFPMSWNNPVDTQLKLIKTRPNAEEVIRRLGLKDATGKPWHPDRILGGVSADVDKNTDVIMLGYSTSDPTHAAAIVNEMGRVVVERNRSFHQETSRKTREFIEEQLKRTEKMLTDAEEALRAYREANVAFDVTAVGQAAAQRVGSIDASLIDMEVERELAQHKLKEARRDLGGLDTALQLRMEYLKADRVFNQLQGQLAAMEAKLTTLKTQYSADTPDVKDVEVELNKLRAAIQTRVRFTLGRQLDNQALISDMTPTQSRAMNQMIQAQSELAQLDARAQALKGSRSAFEQRFHGMPAKEQQMAKLLRQQRAAEEAYSVFFKRMQDVRITEAMNIGNLRMIEEAAAAQARLLPTDRRVALGALLGLIFGLGIALLIEFLDDRIRRPEEAQSVLELPILGLLPWVEGREAARGRLVTLDDPRSPVTESYRALQTYTRMVDADRQPQCFLITSPGPKEGKSTVLANLAVTSAQLGRRTLVVDTDLRAPSQHIAFDRPNLVGIYDIVYEGCPLSEAVQATDVDRLDLLSTGPIPPDAVQTLHAEAFRQLVDRLRGEYDTIFFDSPPINLFTDAAVLGRLVDTALLVVDVRSTTRRSTLTAKELLAKAKVPLAGLVVKNTIHQMSRNHQRYYKRYYMDRLKQMAND